MVEDEDGEGTLERVATLVGSAAYRRADQDLSFLQRSDLRAARLLLEYLKPELAMVEAEIASTVVLFGGARILEPDQANRRWETARAAVVRRPQDPAAQRALRRAERLQGLSHYYEVARTLAQKVAQSGVAQGRPREFVLMTGGGPGVMEAGNRGSAEMGAHTIGLNIQLPYEQMPNPYISPELCFQFRYFALRKLHFMQRAKALVAFPGGFGTLDELFDALCLVQTGKMRPIPILLVGKDFWSRALSFEFLAEQGVIAATDLELFSIVDTAEEVWTRICDWHDIDPSAR